MKTIAIVLGVIFVVLAAVYFFVPASSLPAFIPGYEAGLTRVRFKHGVASLVVGVVLFGVAWWLGRK